MSTTMPASGKRPTRLLFDGTELREIQPHRPRPHRRAKPKRDNVFRTFTIFGSETKARERSAAADLPSLREPGSTSPAAGSRRRWLGTLAAIALGGCGALLLVWYVTRTGQTVPDTVAPAVEATAIEEEAVPSAGSDRPTVTFARPSSEAGQL